ncbi:MAG: ABC transporter ATP-binding protein [Proteobacteria bacterium]|nr:ABC transporter ATP-binding protein [Pseudomonadota bacterium]
MISITNLTKRYGGTKALKGVTLEVSPNEILALVGPSGCGKTSLLRLIAGLEHPDDGNILIDNATVGTQYGFIPPHKRKLSMVFQDLALWPHMSVKAHIGFVLKAKKLSKEAMQHETDQILKNVNLNNYNNRYPHQLSGGERQRLAIARAIASDPLYLLMDEPFSNLDPVLKEELQDFIIGLKNRLGMGIIYVTHNIEEVIVMADRIAIMNRGELKQVGTKDEVLGNPMDEFVRRFLKL